MNSTSVKCQGVGGVEMVGRLSNNEATATKTALKQ